MECIAAALCQGEEDDYLGWLMGWAVDIVKFPECCLSSINADKWNISHHILNLCLADDRMTLGLGFRESLTEAYPVSDPLWSPLYLCGPVEFPVSYDFTMLLDMVIPLNAKSTWLEFHL